MEIYIRVWAREFGIEASVQQTQLGPVTVDGTDIVHADFRFIPSAHYASKKGTHGGLRCHAEHAIRCAVDHISAGLDARKHGRYTGSCSFN